jgi:CheY-like chemotaxis protein
MKILLVDSDILLLESLSRFLQEQRQDFECTSLISGELALERISREKFDLIIIDVRLPGGISGFQVKKAMNTKGDKTPVLFLAHEVIDAEIIFRQLGASGFALKPFSGKQLLDVIDKLIVYLSRFKLKREYLKPIAGLFIKDGNDIECYLELSSDYTIGRSKEADIRLDSKSASRQHAILSRNYGLPNNYYTVINYSKNGVLLNGEKILTYCRLAHGDIISFPGCEMKYIDLRKEIISDPYSTYTGNE